MDSSYWRYQLFWYLWRNSTVSTPGVSSGNSRTLPYHTPWALAWISQSLGGDRLGLPWFSDLLYRDCTQIFVQPNHYRSSIYLSWSLSSSTDCSLQCSTPLLDSWVAADYWSWLSYLDISALYSLSQLSRYPWSESRTMCDCSPKCPR